MLFLTGLSKAALKSTQMWRALSWFSCLFFRCNMNIWSMEIQSLLWRGTSIFQTIRSYRGVSLFQDRTDSTKVPIARHAFLQINWCKVLTNSLPPALNNSAGVGSYSLVVFESLKHPLCICHQKASLKCLTFLKNF